MKRIPHDLTILKAYSKVKTKKEVVEVINTLIEKHRYEVKPSTVKLLKYMKSFNGAVIGIFKQSQKTYAKKTGLSETSIRRALKQLEELGAIERIETYKPLSRFKSTHCVVLLPLDVDSNGGKTANQEPESPVVSTENEEKPEVKSSFKSSFKNINNLSNYVFKHDMSKIMNTTFKFFTKKKGFHLEHKRGINDVVVDFISVKKQQGLDIDMKKIQKLTGEAIDAFSIAYKNGYTCITNFNYFAGILNKKFDEWEENRKKYNGNDSTFQAFVNMIQVPTPEKVVEEKKKTSFEEYYKGYDFGF